MVREPVGWLSGAVHGLSRNTDGFGKPSYGKSLLLCTLGLIFVVNGILGADENRTYIIRFYQRFDRNSDGRLEPKEWRSSRSSDAVERAIEDAGLDPDEAVPLKTLIDSRLRGSSRSRDDDKDRGYRAKIGYERLDEDEIPDWFRELDRDRDGQVAMAEFATKWTDKLVADFLNLDINRDGLITPKELEEGAESNGSSSLASTQSSRDRYESSRSDRDKSSGDSATKKAVPKSSGEESASDIPEAYLNYAKNICKKYDENEDGFLTEDEWSEMSRDPSDADLNRDRKITHVEYARWISKK